MTLFEKLKTYILICLLGTLAQVAPLSAEEERTPSSPIYAGARVSRIPFSPFPEPNYFTSLGRWMSSKVEGAQPTLIWIVSLYQGDGFMRFNFQNPTNHIYPFVRWASTEQNKQFLDGFDDQGIKVWIQVEPGDADVETLIDIVLNHYGHHPCIVGFGVDVEWLESTVVSSGSRGDGCRKHGHDY
jgi:hypothetical protein